MPEIKKRVIQVTHASREGIATMISADSPHDNDFLNVLMLPQSTIDWLNDISENAFADATVHLIFGQTKAAPLFTIG